MNGFVRLVLDANLKITSSPLETMSGLLQADECVGDFVKNYAVLDNDETETPSPEIAESDSSEPLRLDLDVLPVAMDKSVEPRDSAALVTQHNNADQTSTAIKIDGNAMPSETGERTTEALQGKAKSPNVEIASLPAGNRKDVQSISEKPELLDTDLDTAPDKRKLQERAEAIPVMEKTGPKDRQIFSDARLATPLEQQPRPKTGPLTSTDAVPIHPVHQIKQTVPVATITTPFVVQALPTITPGTAQTPSLTGSSVPELNMDADGKWVTELSRDIGQLSGSKSSLSFQLKPQHLGQLRVEILANSSGDIVRLETDNENAKALIIGSQGRLEQDIRLSGIKLARVDVTVQDDGSSGPGHQGPDAHPDTQRGRSETRQNDEKRSDLSFEQRHNFGQENAAAPSDDTARYA